MELEEKLEEALERLWIHICEEGFQTFHPEGLGGAEVLDLLLSHGYVTLEEGGVKLTPDGKEEAATVVRRHRLAERLLADVLDTGEAILHDKACKFEHILDRGLEENICTLLGHPKLCPHGKPIPPGRCCLEGQRQPQKVVSALTELSPGQGGRIAYVYAPQASQLSKLMALGILPGAPIRLMQSFPGYVVELGQTRVALDRDIASTIYVRLENPLAEEEGQGPERGGFLHRFRRRFRHRLRRRSRRGWRSPGWEA